MNNEKIKAYPKTDLFEVIDTIGVPHPFCIGPKHIEEAQRFGGMLGKEAIESLEKKLGRSSCYTRGCNLLFDKHEQALLIECKSDLKDPRLKEYLMSIKDQCEKDGFAGFAFVDGRDNVENRSQT